MPATSVKVLNTFNINEDKIDFSSIKNNEVLESKNKINKLDILFKKIEK
jgi:methionyl-tRNA synthetase